MKFYDEEGLEKMERTDHGRRTPNTPDSVTVHQRLGTSDLQPVFKKAY